MKISGIQKVSLVDYDGHISATIFTSGCNFKCPFCHNAGLVQENDPNIPTDEILSYLDKRKKVLDSVCISGGEPTLQHDLVDFIIKIKSMGYLIKLDTNGTNLNILKTLVENQLIDYVAMDIKNSLSNYHLTSGIDKTFDIKTTIEYIMNCGIDYEFRTTLVDGHHFENDIKEIANLIRGCNKYFLQKFEDSGNCLKSDLRPIKKETAVDFQKILKKNNVNTYLRGY